MQRLLHAERIAKLVGTSEKLLGPVKAVNGHEFLGSQHAEGFKQLRADLVLTPVPSGQGQQAGADTLAAAELCQDGSVFVIGMCRDIEQRSHGGQLSQRQSKPTDSLVFLDGL